MKKQIYDLLNHSNNIEYHQMKKLFIIFVLAIVTTIVYAQFTKFTPNQKLRTAEQAVALYYVDTVNEDKLVEDAIRGMLNAWEDEGCSRSWILTQAIARQKRHAS